MRRCAPLSAARIRLLLLMACWTRLRAAGRAVRLAVSVVVSAAVARTAALPLLVARRRLAAALPLLVARRWWRLEWSVLLRLLAVRLGLTRPAAGFRVRARLVLGVARLLLRFRACRLVVCPVCRQFLRRASWWRIPLGLVVALVARPVLPRRMMLAAVMGLPVTWRRFVAVCAGNRRVVSVVGI